MAELNCSGTVDIIASADVTNEVSCCVVIGAIGVVAGTEERKAGEWDEIIEGVVCQSVKSGMCPEVTTRVVGAGGGVKVEVEYWMGCVAPMVVKPPPPVVLPLRSMVRPREPAATVVCAAKFDVCHESESVVDAITEDTDATVAARGEVSGAVADTFGIIIELGSVAAF